MNVLIDKLTGVNFKAYLEIRKNLPRDKKTILIVDNDEDNDDKDSVISDISVQINTGVLKDKNESDVE